MDRLLGTTSGGGVAIDFATSQGGTGFWYNDSQFSGNFATVYNTLNQILGTFELEFPRPTDWLFVGFTSSVNDIAKIEVAMGDADRVTLDNIQYSATMTSVPEPASIALLLAGGLILCTVRHARSR